METKLEVKTRREGEIVEDGFTLVDCRGPRIHMVYQRTEGNVTSRLHIAMPVSKPWLKLDEWCVTEEKYRSEE